MLAKVEKKPNKNRSQPAERRLGTATIFPRSANRLAAVKAGDLDGGVVLAVATASAHIFAAPELLDDELLAACVFYNLANDAGPLDQGGADRRAVGAGEEEHAVKDDLRPWLYVALVDRDP